VGDLTKNLSRVEFACKDGCGLNNISMELVTLLQEVSDEMDKTFPPGYHIPIKITSGCRCFVHNKKEGGKIDSDHLGGKDRECEGADVDCPDSSFRYKFLKAALPRFRRIGIGKTFFHVGVRKENPQEVIWLY